VQQLRVLPCERNIGGQRTLAKQLGGKQEVAPYSQIDFQILMEVPLIKISKLLLKVPKKLKICKNKSCSKIQDLQLSR
jgi:hypothetical protein